MSRTIFVLLALLAVPGSLVAGMEEFDFSGNVDEDRFKSFIGEVRCLVCQNQSLADSDAELAHDLREEIYEQMQQGSGDIEIVDFLVSRYGDFVLYNPPVKPSTYLIWYGPFVLLLIGLAVLAFNLRQRGRQQEAEFSEAERARIRALLGEADDKEGGQ